MGTWIAIGLTLAALSLVLGESALSRLAESVYVGASIGYGLSVLLFDLILPRWEAGTLILPAVLTLALLFKQARPWVLAALAGYGAGVTLPRIVETHVLRQMEATVAGTLELHAMLPSWSTGIRDAEWVGKVLGLLLAFLAVPTVLWRFKQTGESKGFSRRMARLGSMFLMIYLGAAFGNAAQGRLALLQGRIAELAANGYPTLVLGALAALVVWKTRRPA